MLMDLIDQMNFQIMGIESMKHLILVIGTHMLSSFGSMDRAVGLWRFGGTMLVI